MELNPGDVCRHHDCQWLLTVEVVKVGQAYCHWFDAAGNWWRKDWYPESELRLVMASQYGD